jgi:hypothetical protein
VGEWVSTRMAVADPPALFEGGPVTSYPGRTVLGRESREVGDGM